MLSIFLENATIFGGYVMYRSNLMGTPPPPHPRAIPGTLPRNFAPPPGNLPKNFAPGYPPGDFQKNFKTRYTHKTRKNSTFRPKKNFILCPTPGEFAEKFGPTPRAFAEKFCPTPGDFASARGEVGTQNI